MLHGSHSVERPPVPHTHTKKILSKTLKATEDHHAAVHVDIESDGVADHEHARRADAAGKEPVAGAHGMMVLHCGELHMWETRTLTLCACPVSVSVCRSVCMPMSVYVCLCNVYCVCTVRSCVCG